MDIIDSIEVFLRYHKVGAYDNNSAVTCLFYLTLENFFGTPYLYGNYSLRFTPTDKPFNKPNWDEIMTKRDKPAMSDDEFNEAIKELARKEFSTGKRDDKAYTKLCKQYGKTVSPDRKAIYEDSTVKRTEQLIDCSPIMFFITVDDFTEILSQNLQSQYNTLYKSVQVFFNKQNRKLREN